MSWINAHKNTGRVAVLVLLLMAIIGPWTYTSDGVPPPEWCRAPLILLKSDRCVRPMSGLEVLSFMAGAFLTMSAGLMTGATALPERAHEYLGVFLFIVFVFLLLLPFLTTLLMIRGGVSHRLRTFHLIAWGLAAVLSLLPFVSQWAQIPARLWGIWLYIGLAAGALILEALALVASRKAGSHGHLFHQV
jgi:hypothetical protein